MRFLGHTLAKLFLLVILPAFIAESCFAGGPVATITAQPLDTNASLGGSAGFQISASSGTTMSFQWLRNGATISGANQSSYTITNAQLLDQASYSVKVQNGGGSVFSSSALLTVTNVPVTITNQPDSQAFNKNDSATLAVGATGTAPLSYQWALNGVNITGATNSVLSFSHITTNQAGFYTVIVTNVPGAVTSAVAVMTVQAPPYILAQPQSLIVNNNDTAIFSVAGLSKGITVYQWYFNGAQVSGGNSSTLTLANVQSNQSGNYAVVLGNSQGYTTSSIAGLTVIAQPPTITTQPISQAFRNNDAATLTVAATGTTPIYYRWTLNGTNIPGATNSSLSYAHITTNNAGLYTVVATNFLGAATSSVTVVTVAAPPYILSQPQSIVVTNGQGTSFSVTGLSKDPITYKWYQNGSQVSGAGATLNIPAATSNSAGNYSVVLSNPAGADTSVVASLTVVLPPVINFQPVTQSLAVGNTSTFSVVPNTTNVTYQWNLNGSPLAGATNPVLTLTNVQLADAGNYSVALSNLAGFTNSSNATLVVNLPASLGNLPQNQVVVAGQSVMFSVGVTGTPPFSFQWTLNGVTVPGAIDSTLALNSARAVDAGTYAVVVGNAWGPPTNAMAVLTVNVPPTIITPPKSQTAIIGQKIMLNAIATGTTPLAYQWFFNGTPISGATASTLPLNPIQSNSSGNYFVVSTNFAGTATSAVASVMVTNPPTLRPGNITSNGFSFDLPVPQGCAYIILASTNLTGWVPIYTNTAQTDSVSFVDPVGTNWGGRWYRVQIE